jgi:hypothetical protein
VKPFLGVGYTNLSQFQIRAGFKIGLGKSGPRAAFSFEPKVVLYKTSVLKEPRLFLKIGSCHIPGPMPSARGAVRVYPAAMSAAL